MRLLHILGLLTLSAQIYAVPARFHVFRAQMSDGTFQNIRFCGDEYRSYYVNEEGFLVEKEESGCFRVTSLRPQDKEKTASVRAMRASSQDRVAIKPLGSPRIPVILVNFSDEKLTVTETARGIADYYDKYCNGTRDGILYTGAGSRGAVRDYFAQQSDSLFLPEFEVIGPVTLDKPMAYYGENSPSGAKMRGLKSSRRRQNLPRPASHPARGAWIEIRTRPRVRRLRSSRPTKGYMN